MNAAHLPQAVAVRARYWRLSIPVAAQVRIIQTNSQGDNIHLIDPATNHDRRRDQGRADQSWRRRRARRQPPLFQQRGRADAARRGRQDAADHEEDSADRPPEQHLDQPRRPPASTSASSRRQAPWTSSTPTTLERVKSIPTKGGIHNVYVTPDGKYVVAGSIAGQLMTVIDQKTEEPVVDAVPGRRAADGLRDQPRRIDEADLRPAVRFPWLRGRGLRAAQGGRRESSCRTTSRRRRWTRVRSTRRRRTASASRQTGRRCG